MACSKALVSTRARRNHVMRFAHLVEPHERAAASDPQLPNLSVRDCCQCAKVACADAALTFTSVVHVATAMNRPSRDTENPKCCT